MKKRIKQFFQGKWKIIRTCWPYPEGYGTYRENIFGRRTLLDTGLTKQEAEQICKELNK